MSGNNGPAARNYILIDYENVQAVGSRPGGGQTLMVFVGARQHRISTDFAMQVQNLQGAE